MDVTNQIVDVILRTSSQDAFGMDSQMQYVEKPNQGACYLPSALCNETELVNDLTVLISPRNDHSFVKFQVHFEIRNLGPKLVSQTSNKITFPG